MCHGVEVPLPSEQPALRLEVSAVVGLPVCVSSLVAPSVYPPAAPAELLQGKPTTQVHQAGFLRDRMGPKTDASTVLSPRC